MLMTTFLFLMAANATQPGISSVDDNSAWRETPFRLEFGGSGSHATNGLGNWRNAEAQLWIRAHKRFIPVLTFDSQTRPTGSQQNFGVMTIANWSKNFYTVQGFSGAPLRTEKRTYFPQQRFDFRAYTKMPWNRNLLFSAGYTRVNYGVPKASPAAADMPNAGFLWYKGRFVTEGIAYWVKNQPTGSNAGAGTLSTMYGREGKYWVGATVGGGREVYRVLFLNPNELRTGSFSVYAFARKWITRNTGVVIFFDFQNRLDLFQRYGAGARFFWEF